ncbi:hypothetical protein [Picosynechococcus sp. NKBG042902]|uniref:hypothetical protein n=1 Tax=Picosynechococcus sp. NKBG042902 TaxID=490193 RepID=UPI0004AA8664|nr:hypothetical protein [Picosynechococcus sp. NKBG042902]
MLSPELHAQLLRGDRLAAELPARRTDHRRYIVICGVKSIPTKHPNFDHQPWRFRIKHYEIHEAFLDEYPGEENLRDYKTEVVADFETLEKAILRLAGKPVTFQHAAFIDAPY